MGIGQNGSLFSTRSSASFFQKPKEHYLNFLELHIFSVLDGVVKQPSNQTLMIHLELRQDPRYFHRMCYECLPTLPQLHGTSTMRSYAVALLTKRPDKPAGQQDHYLSTVRIISQVQSLKYFLLLIVTKVPKQRFQSTPQKLVCYLLRRQGLVKLQATQPTSPAGRPQIDSLKQQVPDSCTCTSEDNHDIFMSRSSPNNLSAAKCPLPGSKPVWSYDDPGKDMRMNE